jgi:hypothetical protein
MKTSKIIFISLLSVIAIIILSAAIDIRINGERRGDFYANRKVNKQIVPSFKVLCVNSSRNITVAHSDSSYVEVTYPKDSIAPKVNYTIKGDTLVVADFEKSNHRNESISIYATDSLKSIQMNNSDASIMRFGSGRLSLNLNKSSVWMDHDKGDKYCSPTLDVVAKNHSVFDTGDFKADSLGIVLQNSRANIRISAKKISGSLADSSRIDARQSEEISLKKDKTSRINVADY